MKSTETMPDDWEREKRKKEPLQFCFYSKIPSSCSLANYEIAFLSLSLSLLGLFCSVTKNKNTNKTRSLDENSMRILPFFFSSGWSTIKTPRVPIHQTLHAHGAASRIINRCPDVERRIQLNGKKDGQKKRKDAIPEWKKVYEQIRSAPRCSSSSLFSSSCKCACVKMGGGK